MKPSLYLLIPALFLVSCDQQEVDASRLVTRNETTYEINSSTPFTGISLSYHENGQVNQRATFKDGKMEGITEEYFENGTLRVRANVKDGEVEGFTETYYEDGTLASRAYRKDGEFDGIVEMYLEDGTLNFRMNFKDGELLGRCFEPGCTDFNQHISLTPCGSFGGS